MLFNSSLFLCVFFPLVTVLYFMLPHRWRWALLLAASCWFYMAFVPVYILILAFTIAVDYFAGIWIERSVGARRKRLLVLSIIANVGVLAFFKYFNFLNANIGGLVRGFGVDYHIPALGILLPIGLSFHTFQSLSYTIEVYRGHQPAEKRVGLFALYVMFYPQLVAGPIERPGNLLKQLNAGDGHGIGSHFDHDRIVWGLKQMVWGFFKKLVIADRCSAVVDRVYDHAGHYQALSLLLATYLFAVQIYCDFSGYTDIALGAARVMGFDLMVNFRTPYRSASVREFWSRWHISLSSWFRDYVYVPLGGNRVGKGHWYLNLMIVFLLSGLWHGANWTYVIWGALHGGYLVLALIFAPMWARIATWGVIGRIPKVVRWVNILITVHLTLLAWVFFRAKNLGQAFQVLERIATTPAHMDDVQALFRSWQSFFLPMTVILTCVFIVLDPWMDAVVKGERRPHTLLAKLVFAALLCGIALFGYFGGSNFIYFQF